MVMTTWYLQAQKVNICSLNRVSCIRGIFFQSRKLRKEGRKIRKVLLFALLPSPCVRAVMDAGCRPGRGGGGGGGLQSKAGSLRPGAGLTVRSGQGLGGPGLCSLMKAKQAHGERKPGDMLLRGSHSGLLVEF